MVVEFCVHTKNEEKMGKVIGMVRMNNGVVAEN